MNRKVLFLLFLMYFLFSHSVYVHLLAFVCVSLIPSRTFSLLALLLILLIQLIGPPVAGPFLLVRLNVKSKNIK